MGAAPPISPVPISCGIRSPTVAVRGEPVGDDLDTAIDAQKRKHAYFEALDANVPVIQDADESGRTKITDAVFQWFAELQLFQGKDQQGKSEKTLRAYNYRLGFFLDFTAQQKDSQSSRSFTSCLANASCTLLITNLSRERIGLLLDRRPASERACLSLSFRI